jgi:hypothetical protein
VVVGGVGVVGGLVEVGGVCRVLVTVGLVGAGGGMVTGGAGLGASVVVVPVVVVSAAAVSGPPAPAGSTVSGITGTAQSTVVVGVGVGRVVVGFATLGAPWCALSWVTSTPPPIRTATASPVASPTNRRGRVVADAMTAPSTGRCSRRQRAALTNATEHDLLRPVPERVLYLTGSTRGARARFLIVNWFSPGCDPRTS